MREIRFRAWDKVLGMIYDIGMMCQFGLNDIFEALKGADIVIMQYTGLKDKNGTKIYEGDILKHHSLTEQMQKDLLHQIVGKIVIEKGMTYIVGKVSNGYIDEEIKTTNYKALLLSPELFEIIGNIHENPELLEEEYSYENSM